jgi:hypothetical protein
MYMIDGLKLPEAISIVYDEVYTKTVCTSVGSTNVKMLC